MDRDDGKVLKAVVVGASPEGPSPTHLRRLVQGADLVVAADRGFDYCVAADVVPDLLVGDMDSVDAAELLLHGEAVPHTIRLPREKDDSDLSVALDAVGSWAEGEGCAVETVLCGVSGGRLDHQLGVLGVLATHCALRPRVREERGRLWVLGAEDRWVARDEAVVPGQTVSMIPLESASVVSETGFHWELDHKILGALSDLGLSNIVESPEAEVFCHGGVVAVIRWDG